MTPALIEQHLSRLRVPDDFSTPAALAGALGGLLGAAERPGQALAPVPKSRLRGQAVIAFTYDDGHLSNFTRAAPLHLAYGIPANFAVIAKGLLLSDKDPQFMSPQMVRVLHDLGFEISSHGLLHCKRLRDMNLRELHREAKYSKSVIERAIGVPDAVTTYCIPFSRARAIHVDFLHQFYSVVRHAGGALNELPMQRRQCLSSYPLLNDTSFAEIKGWIDTAIETRAGLVLMLHGISRSDTRPARFDIQAGLLEQVLDYVASQSPDRLLPVRLSDMRQVPRASARPWDRPFFQNQLLRNVLGSLGGQRV